MEIFTAIFKNTLKKSPINDPIPDLKLSFRSLCANSNSKRVAPIKGPNIKPGKFPTTKPNIPPNIAPSIPHLLPPIVLAPSAATMLSMKVESIATKKRITRSRGVISSKPVKIASITVEVYTNHMPGKLRMVRIKPAKANIEASM